MNLEHSNPILLWMLSQDVLQNYYTLYAPYIGSQSFIMA